MMEIFVTTVHNRYQPLAIAEKFSILGICGGLEYVSGLDI